MIDEPKAESEQPNSGDGNAASPSGSEFHQPPTVVAGEAPDEHNDKSTKKRTVWQRFRDWRIDPFRTRANWTDKAVVVLTLGIVFLAAMQWKEMHESGGQTNQIISEAKLIEGHQNQLVQDNKTVLGDNREALASVLKENRDELAKVLEQDRKATNAQTDALNGQLAAIQKQTEVAARPWIKITEVKTRGEGPEVPALSFQHEPTWPVDQSQATLQLQISFKNIGRSPAKASVIFELFLPVWKNGYSDVIYQEKKRFCGGFAKKKLGTDPNMEITLFPDEPHDWYGGGAALVDSGTVNYFSDRAPGPYILPVVAVCINYQFGDSPAIYQTSALYEVFRQDDRTRFFEVGKGVPASQIFMLRNEASDESY